MNPFKGDIPVQLGFLNVDQRGDVWTDATMWFLFGREMLLLSTMTFPHCNHDVVNTLPETNTAPTPVKTSMSPENQWLEDVFPTEIVLF